MKKVLAIILLVTICFLTCSCDAPRDTIGDDDLEDIVSVELIEYTSPNLKHYLSWVINRFDELLPFVPANATVLETLDPEKIPDFLDAFSENYLILGYYKYNSPSDICIKLNYENGDFLILWANYSKNSHEGYIGRYSADGTVLSFVGVFNRLSDYKDLVNQYFSYKI